MGPLPHILQLCNGVTKFSLPLLPMHSETVNSQCCKLHEYYQVLIRYIVVVKTIIFSLTIFINFKCSLTRVTCNLVEKLRNKMSSCGKQ